MALYRKLGKSTDQRMAILRNQVSELIWKNQIETTVQKAKEVRRLAEKLITLAVDNYEDTVTVSKTMRDSKGKIVNKEVINDGPKKLSARRKIMANIRDLQELKLRKETVTSYKMRTSQVNHPIVEKLFNDIAPKYAGRAKDKGQAGGYTRIIRTGFRRGDNAEMAIIQLV